MGFLTDDEADSLKIERMTLHVVGGDDEFKPKPEIDGGDHVDFFILRIRDAAPNGVHKFEHGSPTKEKLAEMASGAVSFHDGAVELSRRFAKDHGGATSRGAFFVTELSTEDSRVRFYSLMKYDYREAIELMQDEGGNNALRQIVQAFVREKRAIQKACLVRCVDGIAELEVSAVDRTARAPDLTDYFASFLDVKRERDNAELTRALREVLRTTAQSAQHLIPEADIPRAVLAMKDVLRGQGGISEDDIRDAALSAAGRPEDEKDVAELTRIVNRCMKREKLEGVEFTPDQSIFRMPPRRKLRTSEGALLEFPGELETNGSIKREPDPNGGLRIIVRTDKPLVEDATIPSRDR